MREIKFRGRHKHVSSIWAKGGLINEFAPKYKINDMPIDGNTIGQYTGKTDADGKRYGKVILSCSLILPNTL